LSAGEIVIDRRRFLSMGLLAAAGGCTRRPAARAPSRCTLPTPEDVAGPFLPRRYQGDADLTRVDGQGGRAQGQAILIRGRITDERCRPVPAARLEVWQANTFGRYADDRDHSGRPLDPAFQGSALLTAGADGRYSLRTVKPGIYRGTRTMRAPHVHFRFTGDGCHDDIVQMYFAGEALNDTDENRALLGPDERRRVTIPGGGRDGGATIYTFDVVLRRVEAGTGLERYAGRYVIDAPPGPIPVSLSVEHGKLYADSPPLPKAELRPLGPGRFRLKAFNVELTFDAGGFTAVEYGTGEKTRARRLP
jgi:protocatechuate 3,4-dioxygenase, beta subunit